MDTGLITLTFRGRQYGMRKMPPLQGANFGLKVSAALAKVLSQPSAKESLATVQKAGQEDDIGAVIPAVMGLVSGMDANEVAALFKEAFSYEVYCGEEKLSDGAAFEEHFSKYPEDLYIVAIWATYNHVKDFFSGLGDGVKALMANSKAAKAQAASPFQKAPTSTGR